MLIRFALLVFTFIALAGPAAAQERGAFDFTFQTIEGEPLPLSRYDGKVLLVVNTASFCGFTNQYADLQKVWEDYRDEGLVVIGVPSNDFGAQEPGAPEDIRRFCEVNFGIDFPLAAKANVRGDDAHPFYEWARQQVGPLGEPRWNFHKYLIGRDGRIVDWFPSATLPTSEPVREAIEKQLAQSS